MDEAAFEETAAEAKSNQRRLLAYQKQALDGGVWEVNGAAFKGYATISPVDSFTMVYDYSNYADDYYFVDSEPACWYSEESDHTVKFRESGRKIGARPAQ